MGNVRNKKIIYSFLGLPASGKGTQSENFANRKGLPLISIGELVRDEIEENKHNPDIKEIKNRYDEGIPQEDDVIFDLIKRKLKRIENGAVFDNFPFSENQANKLFDFLEKEEGEDWEKPVLIYIDIKPETSFDRITSRKICPKCGVIYNNNESECGECKAKLVRRADDNEETLKNRIDYYLPRIKQMLNLYETKGTVVKIDGEPSIQEVQASLEKI